MFKRQATYFFEEARLLLRDSNFISKTTKIPHEFAKAILYAIYNGTAKIPSNVDLSPAKVKNIRRSTANALMRDNNLPDVWESGWRFVSDTETGLVATKNGVEFHFPRKMCRHKVMADSQVKIIAGDQIEIRQPAYLIGVSPGYLLFRGNTCGPFYIDSRIYLNIDRHNTSELIRITSSLLGQAGVPYQAKVNIDSHSSARHDSAVVYFHSSSSTEIVKALPTIIQRVPLRLGAPQFTRGIAPGASIALDPGNGISFGQYVISLMLSSLKATEDLVEAEPEELAMKFEKTLASKGIAPERLWALGNETLANKLESDLCSVNLSIDVKNSPTLT